MPKNCFFLNYGGPGGKWYASKEDSIRYLDEQCKENYGPPTRKVDFIAHGLKIRVHTYGYHRALYVELPENASQKTQKLYQLLREESHAFCDKEYATATNNCVSAVTAILHRIDANLVPEYLVLPWTLDAVLDKSLHAQSRSGVMKPFFDKYEQKASQKNYFSFVSQRSKLRAIKSVKEVINQAYHGEEQERERTKSSLIELNWVMEDKQGILHPTKKAPRDFFIGLCKYNQDYQAVTMLKSIVEVQEIRKDLVAPIFQDNPNYATAMERIKDIFLVSNPTIYATIESTITSWQWEHEIDIDNMSTDDDSEDDHSEDDSSFHA